MTLSLVGLPQMAIVAVVNDLVTDFFTKMSQGKAFLVNNHFSTAHDMLLGKWTMFQKLVFHWFSFDWYSLIPEYHLVAFALHPIPVAQYHPSRRLALRSSSWFPRSASLIIRWCRSLVTLNGSGSRNFQVRWFDFFNQGLWKTLGFEWQVHGFWKAYWLVKSNSGKRFLQLHERFECGGGWGLERTLGKWVIQQPWRKLLPLSFFEYLRWNWTIISSVEQPLMPQTFRINLETWVVI